MSVRLSPWRAVALFVALAAPLAEAQRPPRASRGDGGRDSSVVLDHFEPQGAGIAASVGVLLREGRTVCLATVVAPDGLLLSKASEAYGELVCRLHDGRELPVRALASDPYDDVVLLQVEADDLVPARFSTLAPSVGRLVLAPNGAGRVVGMGIVGVAPKAIEGGRGYLGVVLRDDDEGVRIDEVRRDTPAFRVGLQAGDRILEIVGEAVASRLEASEAIQRQDAGAVMPMLVLRDGDELLLEPRLATRDESALNPTRVEGDQSDLRAGFPSALQHDVVIQPDACGGPLLSLDGGLLGLNIARAGRVKTYAIPAARLRELLLELLLEAGEVQPTSAEASEEAPESEERSEEPAEEPPAEPEPEQAP